MQYIDYYQREQGLYIILEFIENGSLKDVLTKFGHFPEHLAAIYIEQVRRAVGRKQTVAWVGAALLDADEASMNERHRTRVVMRGVGPSRVTFDHSPRHQGCKHPHHTQWNLQVGGLWRRRCTCGPTHDTVPTHRTYLLIHWNRCIYRPRISTSMTKMTLMLLVRRIGVCTNERSAWARSFPHSFCSSGTRDLRGRATDACQ